jgi:hypothetical protein
MITDHGVLSEAEVEGVRASLESQNPPIIWRFRDDISGTRFIMDIDADDEASMKYNNLVTTIFDRFCTRNGIQRQIILSKRVIILPQMGQSGKIQKYMYSRLGPHETFVYYATTSDGPTMLADGETILPNAGLSISFNGRTPYVHTNPETSNFTIAIEVEYTV